MYPIKDKKLTISLVRVGIFIIPILILFIISVFHLMNSYHNTLISGFLNTKNKANIIDQLLNGMYQDAENILDVVVLKATIELNKKSEFKQTLLSQYIYKIKEKNDLLESVAIINSEGSIYAHSSWGTDESLIEKYKDINYSDRNYFHYFKNNEGPLQIFISEPMIGKISKKMKIFISKPLFNDGGAFQGVVFVSIDSEKLSNYFKTINPSPFGITVFFSPTQKVIANTPYNEKDIGNYFSLSKELDNALISKTDLIETISKLNVDGIERFFSVRALKQNKGHIVIGESFNYMLNDWYKELSYTCIIFLIALILSLIFLFFISKDMSERDLLIKRYNTILNTTSDGIHILNTKGELLNWNSAFENHLGYSSNELKNKKVFDWDIYFSPDEIKFALENNSERTNQFITNHRKKDGSIRSAEIQSFSICEKDQILIYNSARDITDKLKIEKELRASEANYRSLFEANLAVIILVNPHTGQLIDANPAATQYFGWSHAELVKKTIYDLNTKPENVNTETIQEVLAKGKKIYRRQILLADGSCRDVEVLSTPIQKSDVPHSYLFSIIYDITENIKNEKIIEEQRAQMLESSRLTLLGQIAGGIAHEINNPLAILKGMNFLIQQHFTNLSFEEQKKLTEKLEKIDMTIDRIAKIISGLRSFAQVDDADSFCKVYVKDFIEKVISFYDVKFKTAGIDFKLDFGNTEVITFDIRESQLSQVIINILNNAFDAVVELKNPFIALSLMSDNTKLQIIVCDNGAGVDKSIEDKIMDPFFTTKAIGMGVGLGLSISNGIIKNHSGKIYLDQSSDYTKFIIEIPIHQKNKDILS